MPEPVLVSIAAALAGKSASTLYEVVRRKFARSPEATTVLEEALGSAPYSPQVQALSAELDRAERADPEFASDLRAVWGQVSVQQRADSDGVANQVSGTVSGNVIQARDIDGGVSF
ncbi:MAG: hypothetical protein ACRDTE_33625 [Pseudonocardiaceae bacterium]